MLSVFSNVKIAAFLIVLPVLVGGGVGWFFGENPQLEVTGVTYGFMAFAILPISLCLFGLKEFNGVYSNLAKYMSPAEQKNLSKYIDSRYNATIFLAFLVVSLQVIFAFWLMYISKAYELIIFGILFGGIFSALVYGLFVCYSVRRIIVFHDQIVTEKQKKERVRQFKNSFTEK